VCTFENCTTPDRTFESRHEWFNHELHAHRAWWDCVDGCNEKFQSSNDLTEHIRRAHIELTIDGRQDVVVETRRRQVQTGSSAECVFCNAALNSLTLLRRHVGKHQEELALFSLPSYDADDNDENSNAGESDNEDHSEKDKFMIDPVESISRPVSNAESWAVYDFEMHARQCAYCHDPYDVHRNHDQLCEHGYRLAQEVASFMYNKDGKVSSTKEVDGRVVRLEIPTGYVEVHGLLRAIERSLRHRSRKPFVTLDEHYHVAPRSPVPLPVRQQSVKVEPESSTAGSSRSRPRTGEVVDWPEKIEISDVGTRRSSLYEEDLKKLRSAKYNVEILAPSARDLREYR
jgi:hypothetical protein